ncbi:MAG: transposase [candidate division Zixibacteria bacterium]|nr:transposase [candidate division Zixibacteria bacterium]
MTKLRHYDQTNLARFVTFSTYRRVTALNDDWLKQIVIDELKALRVRYSIRIHGYVLMPEHVHLVLWPPSGEELGRRIGEMKSRSARAFFAGRPIGGDKETRILWQRRCYDHNCRTIKDAIVKINYCHNNPVARGLVTEAGDWSWSSFNWYQGLRDVPLEIDSVEL